MDSLQSEDFSVQDGIEVQKGNLREWKYKLNDKTYNALVAECERQNALPNITRGYDVFRGIDLYDFITNYKG